MLAGRCPLNRDVPYLENYFNIQDVKVKIYKLDKVIINFKRINILTKGSCH